MTVKQDNSGKWWVQVDRKGMPRVRRHFLTRTEALQFEKDYLLAHQKVSVNADRRTLVELIGVWYRYHGVNLSDGKRRKAILEAMAAGLGNPIASELTPSMFLEYRYRCSTASPKAISAKTLNNRQGYLDAMFRKLKKLKIIDYISPLFDVDKAKLHEIQTGYLNEGQIQLLFDGLKACRNKSVWWIAQLCIRTGARWSEAEKIKRKQLHNGKVTFEYTKSKKVRSVPLDEDFYKELLAFCALKQPEDRVFADAMTAFNRVVLRIGLKLPKGQATHILRHSFASYFIMNGGNILTLQRILGHSDIKMTMRYAHLSPDHLVDAVKFNPLSNQTSGGKLAVETAKKRQKPPK